MRQRLPDPPVFSLGTKLQGSPQKPVPELLSLWWLRLDHWFHLDRSDGPDALKERGRWILSDVTGSSRHLLGPEEENAARSRGGAGGDWLASYFAIRYTRSLACLAAQDVPNSRTVCACEGSRS